jgi:hypothetical protein
VISAAPSCQVERLLAAAFSAIVAGCASTAAPLGDAAVDSPSDSVDASADSGSCYEGLRPDGSCPADCRVVPGRPYDPAAGTCSASTPLGCYPPRPATVQPNCCKSGATLFLVWGSCPYGPTLRLCTDDERDLVVHACLW